MVSNVFGYHAIQIGLPHWDLLRANRIPFKGRTRVLFDDAANAGAVVVADPENLPFDSQSIDLLVLPHVRSEEHTSELQSLMRISYAVFCLKKKNKKQHTEQIKYQTR